MNGGGGEVTNKRADRAGRKQNMEDVLAEDIPSDFESNFLNHFTCSTLVRTEC